MTNLDRATNDQRKILNALKQIEELTAFLITEQSQKVLATIQDGAPQLRSVNVKLSALHTLLSAPVLKTQLNGATLYSLVMEFEDPSTGALLEQKALHVSESVYAQLASPYVTQFHINSLGDLVLGWSEDTGCKNYVNTDLWEDEGMTGLVFETKETYLSNKKQVTEQAEEQRAFRLIVDQKRQLLRSLGETFDILAVAHLAGTAQKTLVPGKEQEFVKYLNNLPVRFESEVANDLARDMPMAHAIVKAQDSLVGAATKKLANLSKSLHNLKRPMFSLDAANNNQP